MNHLCVRVFLFYFNRSVALCTPRSFSWRITACICGVFRVCFFFPSVVYILCALVCVCVYVCLIGSVNIVCDITLLCEGVTTPELHALFFQPHECVLSFQLALLLTSLCVM